MLNKLSSKFSKSIATFFASVFIFCGVASLKAQAASNYFYIPNSYNFNQPVLNSRNDIFGSPKQSNDYFNLTPNTSKEQIQKDKLIPKPVLQISEGPGQPEMSSFKSVGTDNMVNLFTGDFSYNIPLLDVGGYPVNMFYNSGITMDQEASWVGLGWNINPGSIMRNMRGLPDDFNGADKIIKRQSIRPDETWGVTGGAGVKFAGFPIKVGKVGAGFNFNAGLSFNNKLGLALEYGIHPSLSISTQASDNKTTSLSFGANLNSSSRNGASLTPSINLSLQESLGNNESRNSSLGVSFTQTSRSGITGLHLNASLSKSKNLPSNSDNIPYEAKSADMAVLNSNISFAYPTILPSIRTSLTRQSYSLSFSVGGEFTGLNVHGRLNGYYMKSIIAPEDQETMHPAYGMLYYQNAKNDQNALLDFNRTNDGVYTPNTPAIALPIYTYDVFSIMGEGTGGSFKASRGDIGHVNDAFVKTKDNASTLGLDIGLGNVSHGGAEFTYAYTPSTAGDWKLNNLAKNVLQFNDNEGVKERVYFKNPGEKTIPDEQFQENVGGEKLVRFKLGNVKSGTPMLLPNFVEYDESKNKIGEKPLSINTVTKNKRDKRTQVISFLNAEEANLIGFDKKIYSYQPDSSKIIFGNACNKDGIDSFPRYYENYIGLKKEMEAKKRHHISEIDILGADGRKYIYGIPVYNTKQIDVSFSIDSGNVTTGKSNYSVGDDDTNNRKGRDWYMNQEETPAYAHSFLLTSLLSPNYVDVTGDGISEDDMGDAIKFNYSKFDNGYKWRTPTQSYTASYSQGLKTDNKDDKAHYIYGERELWHLYSIESKNMVARFYVNDQRDDARQVEGQSGQVDILNGMQKLYKISLFSKGDLLKFGNDAKPIKTIKFFQSQTLCANDKGGGANTKNLAGKLTLDSIWITYNGNDKKPKSRYVFSYPTGDQNPSYEYNANDRWGNYKPTENQKNGNPGNLSNADFPYSVQDKEKADKYAGAWVMNKIQLPSGGVINIQLESDDYAYVQQKKAAAMFEVFGFGDKPNPSVSEQTNASLYTAGGGKENNYIYIKLSDPITSLILSQQENELRKKYFENDKTILMKLAVKMPDKPGLSGFELITIHAEIEKFGIVPGTEGAICYVQVKLVENGSTPMVQQSLQFLKQQLPGKAYPSYDVKENSTAKAVVLALADMMKSIKSLKIGEDNVLKKDNKCRVVLLENSFIRLTNPTLFKYGGGSRVKSIIINDNWNKMTGAYESTYGQEYKYTKTEILDEQPIIISSGVASWEPQMGADENPYKEVMRFMNHNKKGPYEFGAVELPIGEAFYPSPTVGYSRIEVLSIHRDTVKNLPTRQVTEFYTNREFPFKSSSTLLTDPEANVKYEPSPILKLLKLNMRTSITQSQGFLVEMNDMSGKIKSESIYSALDSITPVSKTTNYYNIVEATKNSFKFNHAFPTLAGSDGQIKQNSIIGKDIEVMTDFREHTTETITANLSVNFDFFFWGIFPVPLTNILRPVVKESTIYRSASVLKLVNHYAILDSVEVLDKGSLVSTKNLVYDAETGNPLLTRTNNSFNKPVYNFSYPAHWAYSGMGPAYKNINAIYKGLTFRKGLLETPIESGVLESGDELYVVAKNNRGPAKDPNCDGGSFGTLTKNEANRIWVVNTGKPGNDNLQNVFMDRFGNPYTAVDATIKVVRSGHRNMLDQSIGNITSLQYPVDENGKLKFDDSKFVIQSGAATFKEHWKVDNAFYQVDSAVVTQVPLQVRKLSYQPIKKLSLFDSHCQKNKNDTHVFDFTQNPPYFNTEYYSEGTKKIILGYENVKDMRYGQSWAQYDFSNLPPDAEILNASLNLYAHTSIIIPQANVHKKYLACNKVSEHNNRNSHSNVTSNTFFITRAKQEWNPIWNNNQWKDFFYNQNYIDPSNLVRYSATYSTTKSYICDYINDNRPDITLMVKKMLKEKNSTSFTGIKISHKLDISQNFSSWDKKDLTSVCFEEPIIDIYYTSCAQDSTQNDMQNFLAAPTCSIYFDQKYCTSIIHQNFCISKFSKKAINPYVEGILGNWRLDTSFSYYGNRKEINSTEIVDTRIAGSIDLFKTFWNLNSTYLTRNYAANKEWVWNSTITQYNRKGYEIENKDPLGRFNSGLYGYNQHLPVAIANNARVREIMFDGFEDYDYETDPNCLTCKPRRHANIENIKKHLDTTQSHSGRRSLMLSSGESLLLNAPVTDVNKADEGYGLRIKIDSTSYMDTIISYEGNGWKADYANLPCSKYPLSDPDIMPAADNSRIDLFINLQRNKNGVYSAGKPSSEILANCSGSGNYYRVRWEGYIQPSFTGNHFFKTLSDDGIQVRIDTVGNEPVIKNWNSHDFTYNYSEPNPVFLFKGQYYRVQVDYYQASKQAAAVLFWKAPNMSDYGLIPTSSVFTERIATVGPITNWCTKLDSVQVQGNALTDTFSLIKGANMIFSTWVKEDSVDCKCSTYVNNKVVISYTGSPETETLYATGNIIEGWQRYEAVFKVPETATNFHLQLQNTNTDSVKVYFDDIRILPFNANMKSFVYHSSNLRLMAELDENNFASFYEYDDDGTLIRVKKETIEGIKTITETRSSLQKTIK